MLKCAASHCRTCSRELTNGVVSQGEDADYRHARNCRVQASQRKVRVPVKRLSSHANKPRVRDRWVSESPQRGHATLRLDPSQTLPAAELMDVSFMSSRRSATPVPQGPVGRICVVPPLRARSKATPQWCSVAPQSVRQFAKPSVSRGGNLRISILKNDSSGVSEQHCQPVLRLPEQHTNNGACNGEGAVVRSGPC